MKEKLITECLTQMKNKGLLNEEHKERFKLELREISSQNMVEYFLEAQEKGYKWEENENNLLIPYLLGLVDEFDISKPPVCEHGEFPDIDIDYLPVVRDYLKKWAVKKFGENNICSIGNFTTFGLKSALIDMARVHGKSREEILTYTTQLGLKDDEGKALTWDKALELNEGLAEYCKKYPDVAKAARILVNRRRGKGMHAGGLIVSSSPINDLVPLYLGKDGSHVSAWTEGLHDQDLQPVGLIKFDLLVVTDILRIATIVNMIKERRGINSINAMSGHSDWTDLSYLNDPKALALANIGDTKGIFQFDSEGIRRLLREGGVTSFEDLVAYSSLFRPGPLGKGMDKHYCKRKRGLEKYVLHPLMKPILGNTYSIMVYQEQVMKILNVVGDIPLKDCEVCRKAISKKKISKFMPYKEKFVERGQVNLKASKEQVEELWDQIESFSEYGFNRSHACAYSYISARLLWLKAHYPMEFYCVTLSLEKELSKIKDYINDAKAHDVIIQPIDINRSGADFKIHDDEIYYGLSKVKGIGIEISKRIEDNIPYEGFFDFMNRFGTEAKVIQPLIALGAFKDAPKSVLHKFYNVYRDISKKRKDRRKRFEATIERHRIKLVGVVGEETADKIWGNWEQAEEVKLLDKEELFNELMLNEAGEVEDIWKKWKRSVETFYKKERESDEDDSLNLDLFEPDEHYLSSDFEDIYDKPEDAEELYYGFKWTHPLERSDDYRGLTFEALQQSSRDGQILAKGPVQIIVLDYKAKTSKNKNVYHQLEVEDGNSFFARINIWKDDHQKYGENEFKVGNFLQLSVCPPQGGFKTYTMARAERKGKWHSVDKENDVRVIMMHKPLLEENQSVEKTFADVGLIEID